MSVELSSGRIVVRVRFRAKVGMRTKVGVRVKVGVKVRVKGKVKSRVEGRVKLRVRVKLRGCKEIVVKVRVIGLGWVQGSGQDTGLIGRLE